jgi:hypothetical protein
MNDSYPSVPDDLLHDDWERRATSEETVFRAPTATVVGHTVLYDHRRLREALASVDSVALARDRADDSAERIGETPDDDGFWRFFFATSLSFQPPLAPGIGPASMLPTVTSEAQRSFAADFRSRGFEGVQRGRSQRVRTASGARARLRKYTATLPVRDVEREPVPLDVEGWLAVWVHRGSFRVAGGAYPTCGLDELVATLSTAERPPTDPDSFRDELIDLIRAVR